MTTERKTPRNTTELPISVAIDKLRSLNAERRTERAKRLAAAEARIDASLDVKYADKGANILRRIPDELRGHVETKAREPAPMQPVPGLPAGANETRTDDAAEGGEPPTVTTTATGTATPEWLDEDPGPTAPVVEINRETGETRRTGVRRNG